MVLSDHKSLCRGFLALVVALMVVAPLLVGGAVEAEEPRVFVLGVWPDQLRFFDEKTDEFIGDMTLRHGPVMWPGSFIQGTTHSADFRRLFFITDKMEAVEVVDPAQREVIDEVKLSTLERKVRILSVIPTPDGMRVYLQIRAVRLERDRFIEEEPQVVLYDLESDQVVEVLRLPEEVKTVAFYPSLLMAPDGESLWTFASGTVYQLDKDTLEVTDKIELSKPLLAGYGPLQGLGGALAEAEPGVLYGLYGTEDPFLGKKVSGIARIDLMEKRVSEVELGPDLDLGYLTVSLDGKRAYAGMKDLIAIDLESGDILAHKEEADQGRTHDTLIEGVSGKKLYVTGVGSEIDIYDPSTLELQKKIFVGADYTIAPLPIPRSVALPNGR